MLDDWLEGVARKRWLPRDDVLSGDGSMFGGYIDCGDGERIARASAWKVAIPLPNGT